MGYIDNHLMKGEEVVYKASLHWAIYIPTALWLLLGILMIAISVGEEESSVMVIAIIFYVFAVFALIKAIIANVTSEFAVTNKRLILKEGLIARNIVELMLTKCEGVALDQGILGRILGYGTLITTTGGATNKFRKIKDPIIFRNYIKSQVDEAQKSK